MRRWRRFTKLTTSREVDIQSETGSGFNQDDVISGLNLTQYRTLMPAVESPVGVPVKSQSIGLGKGYRDPTMFRYSCFNRPRIDPCPPVSFVTSK